jgi:hypothetical protein
MFVPDGKQCRLDSGFNSNRTVNVGFRPVYAWCGARSIWRWGVPKPAHLSFE